MAKSIKETVDLNKEQAKYYDSIHEAASGVGQNGYANNRHANGLTRAWARLRSAQQAAVRDAGIEQIVRSHHEKWINDLTGGDFLEIGCFSGSPFTMKLVEQAGSYLGIELSSKAVDALNKKLFDAGYSEKATAISADFLSMKDDRKYDLIYAHGVLHHFENPELLFSQLRRLAKPRSILLFVDPVAINPIYRTLRAVYRPLQSDSAWEWPFSKSTVNELEK